MLASQATYKAVMKHHIFLLILFISYLYMHNKLLLFFTMYGEHYKNKEKPTNIWIQKLILSFPTSSAKDTMIA